MTHLLGRRILFVSALVIFCALFATSIVATLTMQAGSSGELYAPRGSTIRMLSLTFKATVTDMTLGSIEIKNVSPFNSFKSNGVSAISIYRSTGSGGFDSTQTPLARTTFTALTTTTTLEPNATIASGNEATFFIAYTIASDATLTTTTSSDTPSTTRIEVTKVFDSTGTLLGLNTPITSTATITGIKKITVRNIAPKVVIPGQVVGMAAISVKPIGENLAGNIAFTINNSFKNFSTTGADTGISNLYLLRDSSANGAAWGGTVNTSAIKAMIVAAENGDPQSIKLNSTATFNTLASEASFKFASSGSLTFLDSVSTNMLLVYTISDNFAVTANTFVEALVSQIKGTGANSGFIHSLTNAEFTTLGGASRPPVAGLAYSNIQKIRVNGNFGTGTVLPILQFSLSAFQSTINVSQISLGYPDDGAPASSTNVPFVNTTEGVDGVTRVRIYKDNGNGSFDGVNSLDTLIGTKNMGASNLYFRTDISLASGNSAFVAIPKFDDSAVGYPLNHSALFFAVYDIGTLSAGRVKVISQLEDARGIAVADEITTGSVTLSGIVPGVPSVSVTIKGTNAFITSCNAIAPSPGKVVQGRAKVPMLYMKISSQKAYTTASNLTTFTILNPFSTFFANGKGVTKIWLYQDVSPLGVFDPNDKFIASNDNLTNTSTASLSGVGMESGDNFYFLLYDIGQNATVDTDPTRPSIRSQLSTISGTGLVLGGETPAPQTAASVSVINSRATIAITSTSPSNPQTTFNITYKITNTSANPLIITALLPRFYLNSLGGDDVGSYFNYRIDPTITLPLTIASLGTADVLFTARLARPSIPSTIYVDASLRYKVPSASLETVTPEASITRYKFDTTGSGLWRSGVLSPISITNRSSATIYAWTLPTFIESMTMGDRAFFNGTAAPPDTSLKIQFVNKGSSLSSTGFTVLLNGAQIPFSTADTDNTASPFYLYDESQGQLTVSTLQNKDGTVIINAKDSNGLALAPATITYFISSASDPVRLSNPLFYPNPYYFAQPLSLGFNLTAADTTISFYVYNHLGLLVWNKEKTITRAGYIMLSSASISGITLDDSSFLSDLVRDLTPGIYLCKIVATDSRGNTSRSLTKFSVY